MVHFRGKSLLPARIDRFGKGSTNIARHDLRDRAQFSHRPEEICYRKPPAFPICDRFFAAKTIEIDCDINVFSAERFRKLLKVQAPIIPQYRALAMSIFRRPIVCPRVHFKNAPTFSATITENLMRPPAFEITATPNTHAPYMWKLQCAIDPATASPFRRTHVPIRMIIERNEHDWSAN